MAIIEHPLRRPQRYLPRGAALIAVLCAAVAATLLSGPSGRVQVSLNLSTDLERMHVEFNGEGLFHGR